ncbi:unnamed protein product [Ectocarpus sp. CCAP 1310/34]|nr:unnamed protein product [Ectocarpus sp. CCAP 1310/34]
MLFVVRRLQELGRRKKIPLYMCFVDLKRRMIRWTERRTGEDDDVEVFGEFGLTVSEKKTETLLMSAKDKPTTTSRPPPPPPLTIEAAGQKYAQTTDFRYLGGLVNEHGDLTREINYRSRGAWACLRRYGRELFDRPQAPFRLKIRLLQAEAMEALLYGCMTWSPLSGHYQTLRSIHHRLLLRVIRGGQEQNWPKCVLDDLKAFGANHGSTKTDPCCLGIQVPKDTAPKKKWTEAAKMEGGVPWHAAVLQGAERFMTSWHEKEEEASGQRALKRNHKQTINGAGRGQETDETAREEGKREETDGVREDRGGKEAQQPTISDVGDDDTGVGLEDTPAADTGVAAAGEDDMGAGLPPTPAEYASVAAAGGVEADVRIAAPAPGGVAAEMGLANK